MESDIIKGQEQPELLGWRVYGETANPWPVPTYSWKTSDQFTKAWIICAQEKSNWFVKSADVKKIDGDTIVITAHTGYGDHLIMTRPGAEKPVKVGPAMIKGDTAVICLDRKGEIITKLDAAE